MPRPSAEDRKIIPLQPDDRIEPPDNLTAAERKLFLEVLQKCPPKQFSMADVYLLVSFTRATLTADRATRKLAKARSTPRRNSPPNSGLLQQRDMMLARCHGCMLRTG